MKQRYIGQLNIVILYSNMLEMKQTSKELVELRDKITEVETVYQEDFNELNRLCNKVYDKIYYLKFKTSIPSCDRCGKELPRETLCKECKAIFKIK